MGRAILALALLAAGSSLAGTGGTGAGGNSGSAAATEPAVVLENGGQGAAEAGEDVLAIQDVVRAELTNVGE